ncbi:MAG: 5-oxoprolinase subunit PxpB [Marinobacter sp.]|nr:5-oxoprolinase subunit PxpB [Marinobacter sp.]
MKITAVSEDSVLVTFADAISDALPRRIALLCNRIEADRNEWLVDLVPSYTTLLVIYDPVEIDFRRVEAYLERSVRMPRETDPHSTSSDPPDQTTHDIPVYYSPESGPDLERIAREKNLSVDEVVSYHTGRTYTVYAIGFAPGFGFMGEVDSAIAAPRKDTPRSRVPAGSVGIANRQTAVYPKASPGGWQLIGRSPVTLFDPTNLSLLSVGDLVRFHPVSRERFLELGGEL